jgi:hypothetical protein
MHSSSRWKEALRRFIPPPLLRLRQGWRNRRRAAFTRRLFDVAKGRVLAGPFAGLGYLPASTGSVLGAKLLGTYESELHPVIEEFIASGFDLVVNAGAGEGYYAVGLAVRIPEARVVAFEVEETGREQCLRLAAHNGVGKRCAVSGLCTSGELVAALATGRRCAVVADVEGAEAELLDPTSVPGLAEAAVLVEVHERLKPGVTERLLGWYTPTHQIRRIPTRPAGGRVPAVAGLPPSAVRLLQDEMRPWPMEWFWMTPGRQGNA